MVGALDMPDDHPALARSPSRPNYGDRVIRRSFRFGLALGLIGGLAAALAKVLSHRADPSPAATPTAPSAPWPPLVVDEPVAATPAPAPRLVDAVEDPLADVEHTTQVEPPVERTASAAAAPAASTAASAPAPVAPKPRKATLKSAPAPARATPSAAAPPKEAPARKSAPAKKAAKPAKAAPLVAWVEPVGDVCPTTHPVKAKLASKIFHVPGGLSYARTRPDRCYSDPTSAESDGLRPAKR